MRNRRCRVSTAAPPAWPGRSSSTGRERAGDLPQQVTGSRRPDQAVSIRPCPSGQVEPVCLHDLVPRGHEVTHEPLLAVYGGVDLRERPELRVRAEDEVDRRGGPADVAGGAVAALVGVLLGGRRLPLRVEVEQVHEEVVREQAGAFGEDAVLRTTGVGAEGPQAAG